MPNKHTPGDYYIAERAYWQGDVRFIRTSFDKSGVIGLTNDKDAPLFAASLELFEALKEVLVQFGDFCCDNCINEEELTRDNPGLVEAINKADLVLKKARGE